MNITRLAARLSLLPLLLSTSGCCSLARFFCGPDTSPWVQVAYDTPQATMRTFLEAIRRDNPDRVLACLSSGYRQEHQLTSTVIQVAWEKLRQQEPYLFMLGYVTPPDQPTAKNDRGCSFTLDVDGKPLRIDLVRQTSRQVYWQKQDGTVVPGGAELGHDSWNGLVAVEALTADPVEGTGRSRVDLLPFEFEHGAATEIPLDRLVRIELVREWKISNVTPPQ